jgi:SAM-dependent methyltransferase
VPLDDHLTANLRNWESRVPVHAGSSTYGLERYVADPDHRSVVVETDLPHLGDLRGLRVAHLQCHIGTDSLSLARAGATVTGIDFSPAALAVARDLSARAGPEVRFVEAAVDEVPEVLAGERFDLVYTTVGVIDWLPSMPVWARVAAGLLRPEGRLYLRDGHPMRATLDDERDDDLLVVVHPYGAAQGPLRWDDPTTYTDGDAVLDEPITYEWNHGIGEVVQAVLDAGMRLTELWEGFELDWPALPTMVERDGRYVLPDRPERLPMEFRLQAVREDGQRP